MLNWRDPIFGISQMFFAHSPFSVFILLSFYSVCWCTSKTFLRNKYTHTEREREIEKKLKWFCKTGWNGKRYCYYYGMVYSGVRCVYQNAFVFCIRLLWIGLTDDGNDDDVNEAAIKILDKISLLREWQVQSKWEYK